MAIFCAVFQDLGHTSDDIYEQTLNGRGRVLPSRKESVTTKSVCTVFQVNKCYYGSASSSMLSAKCRYHRIFVFFSELPPLFHNKFSLGSNSFHPFSFRYFGLFYFFGRSFFGLFHPQMTLRFTETGLEWVDVARSVRDGAEDSAGLDDEDDWPGPTLVGDGGCSGGTAVLEKKTAVRTMTSPVLSGYRPIFVLGWLD